jgi:hypothetical protein
VRCVKEVLVAQGLLGSAATRIAPPLTAEERALLLTTARRAGVLGSG